MPSTMAMTPQPRCCRETTRSSSRSWALTADTAISSPSYTRRRHVRARERRSRWMTNGASSSGTGATKPVFEEPGGTSTTRRSFRPTTRNRRNRGFDRTQRVEFRLRRQDRRQHPLQKSAGGVSMAFSFDRRRPRKRTVATCTSKMDWQQPRSATSSNPQSISALAASAQCDAEGAPQELIEKF